MLKGSSGQVVLQLNVEMPPRGKDTAPQRGKCRGMIGEKSGDEGREIELRSVGAYGRLQKVDPMRTEPRAQTGVPAPLWPI